MTSQHPNGGKTLGSAFALSQGVFDIGALSWSELARRTWREAIDDDVLGLAAQLSYYFFLALFPAILFLLALASFFPLANITDDVRAGIAGMIVVIGAALVTWRQRR